MLSIGLLARLYPFLEWRRGSKLRGLPTKVSRLYVYSTRGAQRRAVGVCPIVYSAELAARASLAVRRAAGPRQPHRHGCLTRLRVGRRAGFPELPSVAQPGPLVGATGRPSAARP